jgi:hypothetical protein
MASPTAADLATASRTIIGPLTTTFTPLPECSVPTRIGSHLTAQTYADLCAVWWPDCRAPDAAEIECLPSSTGAWNTAQKGAFYSPGLHCPHGWQTVYSVTGAQAKATDTAGVTGNDIGPIERNTMLAGETAALCCPR